MAWTANNSNRRTPWNESGRTGRPGLVRRALRASFPPSPTLRGSLLASILASIFVTGAAIAYQPTPTVASDNRRCLNCHGQPHIGQLSPRERHMMLAPGAEGAAAEIAADSARTRPALYLGPDVLTGRATHASIRCTSCHADSANLPHPPVLAPARCDGCHQESQAAFDRSAHAAALAAGDTSSARCSSCHGGHDIGPPTRRDSLTNPLNIIRVCGDCHQQHTAPTSNGNDSGELVQAYLDSVHGKAVTGAGLVVAATCADCHGYHEVESPDDPRSPIHRDNVPTTCGECHLGVVETYAMSIHGQLLADGDERAPVCTDCHTAHAITRSVTPEFVRDIVSECGECHDRPEMHPDRRASFYRTYRASYHGQVNELGSTRAARCSDCHGAHDILPISDEASQLHESHLITTCRKCHEGAPARFAEFDPHADYLDADRYPLLNGVWWYFIIVISAAIGFFGLHSLLWFLRSLIERARNGGRPRRVHGAHAIRRFTLLNRVNHALLIVPFFGLTVTGLPLLFSDQPWANTLAAQLGGIHAMGLIHRIFAILLIGNFIVHLVGLVRKALAHRGSLVQDWVIGPNTMLPRWKDVTDCLSMIRWFLRGGAKPSFDRWTYWEKFDYLAEIAGTFIIGGSGLMLWFPSLFSAIMPGWMFNIASIVHGYEALLAVSFIFTIHFFNAHLRIEKFPVDDVIFTGQLSEEEFRHERPVEYARLVETGQLEAARVPAAPSWQRTLAVIVGVLAQVVGFTIVALIILAGAQAI